jgi:acyl-coenzyme A thioesterase PaaI-like protein
MDSTDPDSVAIVESAAEALTRVFGALHPPVTVAGATVHAEFRPQPEHRGIAGWLHGGMAATLLDHVCARCAGVALGTPVVTGRLDVRYRRSVRLDGGPYRVEATHGPRRGRTVRVEGVILDPEGRPLVQARSLFVERPADPGHTLAFGGAM